MKYVTKKNFLFRFAPLSEKRQAPSCFDLYFHTRWQVQLGQCINGTGRRCVNVQQTLVRSQLKLLTALLVHVRGTEYSKDLFAGRQWNGSCYYRACATHSLYNF